MAKQNKVVSVLSTSAISGLVASALMTSQAFAAVDAYTVKVGGDVYQYSKTELMESYLDSTEGTKAPLFEDFQAKMTAGKGVYAYHDDKSGYVTAQSVFDKYLENEAKFNLDEFTASKDAKVTEVPTVKKAVVKDGEVKFEDQNNGEAEEGKVKVESVSAINLKQVKIEFASKVTDSDLKDDVEDIDNYTLEDKDGDEVKDVIKEVKLDDSKKFAILTFRDMTEDKKDNFIIENQEKYTLIIDEDAVGKEFKEELKFKDLDLPKVEDVESVGIDTIKVKFSEPITPDNLKDISDEWKKGKVITPELNKDDFDINDGDLSIRKVELVNNNTEANIIVTSDFKDGEKVSVKVKSSVKDYAGLAVVSETKDVTVKEDKKAPEVIGFKDAESDKITLIFDKDVKFADVDANKIDNKHSDLDKFYHTSDRDGNYAEKVEIDGKEVTLYFAEDSISDGSTNIYIKSDVLESRWDVKNNKVSYKIHRDEDKVAPELVKVEQDEDYNNKIKIRFSEKVKTNKGKDSSALKTGNYTIKDNKGKEWKIKEITQDGGSSEKEFVIITTKDLDDDLKYTLTVEGIEDKAGNAIKKVTKDFKVTDSDSVAEGDVKVTVYSRGTNDQKILVDFDSKMTMDNSKYSAKDLSKYTLISTDKSDFDNKGAITLDQLYKASIKSVKDGKAVEMSIPGKKESDKLKDKQFNLNELKGKLSIQIARVADEKGNLTDKTFTIDKIKVSGKDAEGSIGFDKDADYVPQAKSVEHIYFAFDDKVNFDSDDIMVVAAEEGVSDKDINDKAKEFTKHRDTATDTKSTDGKMIKNLPVAKFKTGLNDGNTDVLMTLDKGLKDKRYDDDDYNHILSYEGQFIERDENGVSKKDGKKLNVYVVVIDNDGKTETDNDYDETLIPGVTPIEDKIGPSIVNNKTRADKYKYIGNDQYGEGSSLIKDDDAVEYINNGDNTGFIVLTFEENIKKNSVSTSTFELKKDDFKDAKISDVEVAKNKITLKITNLIDQTKDKTDKDYKVNIEDGLEIMQKGPIKDNSDNELDGLRLQIGAFDDLEVAKKSAAIKSANEAISKLPEASKITELGAGEGETSVAVAKEAVKTVKSLVEAATKLGATKEDGTAKDINTTKLTAVENKIAELAPVGVGLGATAETTKGIAQDAGANQVSTIKVATGAATAAGNITVAGKTVAVLKDDNVSAVATKIKTELDKDSSVWKVTVANDTLTFTAVNKVANVDAIEATDTGTTGVSFAAQSDTTKGKAPVAATPGVATTTVTAGANKAGNITVRVNDGSGVNNVDVVVPVTAEDDTAAEVAAKIAAALNANDTVKGVYTVTANGADVVLTQNTGAATQATVALQ